MLNLNSSFPAATGSKLNTKENSTYFLTYLFINDVNAPVHRIIQGKN